MDLIIYLVLLFEYTIFYVSCVIDCSNILNFINE